MRNANSGQLSSFYSGGNEIEKQEKKSTERFSQALQVSSPTPAPPKNNPGGLNLNLFSGNHSNPLSSLFSGLSGGLSRGFSGGFGEGLSNIMANLQADDLLLLLVIILLLNENNQDDYLVLIILGVLFFT